MIFVFSACESLLSPLSLSDAQKVRLHSVEVLCCWCACDSLEAAHTIGVPSEVQASTMKSKLLELLNTDNIDLSRPVDVQLVSRDYSITNLDSFFKIYSHLSDLDTFDIGSIHLVKRQRKYVFIECLLL